MNERLAHVINHPLHRHLGITAIESTAGCGALSVIVDEAVLNPAGSLHGGVLYLLADVCAYAGLLSRLADDREAVTHDIHVSVMRSVALGSKLNVASKVERMGRRLCFIAVTVDVDGELVATARVTKSLIVTQA